MGTENVHSIEYILLFSPPKIILVFLLMHFFEPSVSRHYIKKVLMFLNYENHENFYRSVGHFQIILILRLFTVQKFKIFAVGYRNASRN